MSDGLKIGKLYRVELGVVGNSRRLWESIGKFNAVGSVNHYDTVMLLENKKMAGNTWYKILVGETIGWLAFQPTALVLVDEY